MDEGNEALKSRLRIFGETVLVVSLSVASWSASVVFCSPQTAEQDVRAAAEKESSKSGLVPQAPDRREAVSSGSAEKTTGGESTAPDGAPTPRAEDGAGGSVADLPPFGETQYRLGPEDVVEVFVWEEPELSTTATVRPDGFISLPLVDDVEASGKTVEQLKHAVRRRLAHFVTEPTVNVIVTEINSPRITVLGEVSRPDVYRMRQGYTVLDAIALAGGFTEFADRDKVTVIRNGPDGPTRIKVRLKRLIDDDGSELFYLQPSDIVFIK